MSDIESVVDLTTAMTGGQVWSGSLRNLISFFPFFL